LCSASCASAEIKAKNAGVERRMSIDGSSRQNVRLQNTL